MAVDPHDHVVADAGRVATVVVPTCCARASFSWCTAGGTASQKNSTNIPSTPKMKKKIASAPGTRRRRSHSTPGRIAAANVSARSRGTMMLRTFQSPNASAATAIAPAAALAAVTAMSGRRTSGAGLGSRVAMREDDR
jgi:hypothetical protein